MLSKDSQWQPRRKPSLGKLRRAHPASGATWNVQVVRGKMTSKCLWHACRALVLGMILMVLGAGMATIGYYAEDLSFGQEIRGNATIRVKNESRGFHLNNLSYVGPIIMGFGGFIVVAACVMTFEARDSAAKVVPARFKVTGSSRSNVKSTNSSATSNRRANGLMHQAARWDNHLGVFRTSPAEPTEVPATLDRQALTAALIHFSKTMGNSPHQSPNQPRFPRSGSVPNILECGQSTIRLSPCRKQMHQSPHHHQQYSRYLPGSKGSRQTTSLVNRASRESMSSLLHPGKLQFHRHALSVDETGPHFRSAAHSSQGSQISLTDDARMRDRTKRSDTAKRHILLRQTPIEKDDSCSTFSSADSRRKSSTPSDFSHSSHWKPRQASCAISRTPSSDSRNVQVELHQISPRSPRRMHSGQSTTTSIEHEFRSQLSVCSEPQTVRTLSGQLSLGSCVVEESPEYDEKEKTIADVDNSESGPGASSQPTETIGIQNYKKTRPETLALNITFETSNTAKPTETQNSVCGISSTSACNLPNTELSNQNNSNSSVTTRQEEKMENEMANDTEKNYEFIDSLKVIDERRRKTLGNSGEKFEANQIVSSHPVRSATIEQTETQNKEMVKEISRETRY